MGNGKSYTKIMSADYIEHCLRISIKGERTMEKRTVTLDIMRNKLQWVGA